MVELFRASAEEIKKSKGMMDELTRQTGFASVVQLSAISRYRHIIAQGFRLPFWPLARLAQK